jgi:DNA-binding transcriptional ArsR family regulator
LEAEFGESSNSIRVELNRLEEAGMLESESEGNRRYFKANKNHPLFNDVTSIVRKYVGIDQVIENIVVRLGNLEKVYLTGSLVKGLDIGIIQIVLVGHNIDREFLTRLSTKAEQLIDKKITYLCFESDDFESFSTNRESEFFLIWNNEEAY